MIYSFQLCPHANIRYSDALSELGKLELDCLLQSLGISAQTHILQRQTSTFYRFETQPLTMEQLTALSAHSSLLLMCTEEGELLRPLPVTFSTYLEADLPEVLKYKGKTSARFTHMMLNCARSAAGKTEPCLTILDPLCGKGTTLFCAAMLGHHAIGIDADRNAIREADTYFTRYLEMHALKHSRTVSSETVRGEGVSRISFTFADSKEHYRAGDTRALSLFTGDTASAPSLVKKTRADLIVTDLPYGVQHAPGEMHGMASFQGFLRRVLPAWRDSLKTGGAMALSFNTLTLPRDVVIRHLTDAGMTPLTEPPYENFSHPVEQAIVRDFVVALRT